jgi:hypothetical protein
MTRSPIRSRSALLATALALAAAAGFSLAPSASAAPTSNAPAKPVPTHPVGILGMVPHHTPANSAARGTRGTDETRVCQGCTPPLLYGSGPVGGSTATTGENTEYSIYWTGAGAIPNSYQATIDQYLTDIAAASGTTSNVYSVATQYYQTTSGSQQNITYLSHFGGRLAAPDPLPANGCTPAPGYTSCLVDSQLQTEITNVITAQNKQSVTDTAHMFLLFLPPGVESCDAANSCSANVFCGYHSGYASGNGVVLYSNMPYAQLQGCANGQQPNGDPLADGEIDILSHEINETITDPFGTGWFDSTGHEDGDECSNIYGTPIGSADPNNASNTQYNQRIKGHDYYTQEEFSNASFAATGRGCIQAAGQVAPAGNSVTVSANPTQVPNDGSSTSVVTATVLSPASAAVNGDEVDFATFAKSGTCGTVSPTKATTDTSGHASTTYTAGIENVACTIIATEVATGGAGQGVVAQGVPSLYHPVTPFRLADTRSGSGFPLAGQTVGSGGTATVPVATVDGVPGNATAAVLNVTTTNGTVSSFLTAFPTGSVQPQTSNLNFVAGQTVANLVTVPLGTGGAVTIFNHAGTTDVIVDLEGYMAPGAGGAGAAGLLNSLAPSRIADTRSGSGSPNAGQTLVGGTPLAIQVDGVGGVPATGVSAVVLNVTAADGNVPGFLTAYAADGTRPTASNLNYSAGQVVPNRVIVPVSAATGSVDIYNNSGTVDVIVDVGGWFTDGTNAQAAGARFTPLVPTRIADTRAGSGQPLAGQTLGPAGTISVPVASTASTSGILPVGVVAVAGNVTVADPSASSYLTVYPANGARPLASDLNWVADQVVPNQVIAQLGSNGALGVYNNTGSVDVIVDIFGYWL